MLYNYNAITLAALAAVGNAHMIMNTPQPYGSPDSSPLDTSGSNFPCKGVGYDGDFAANTYEQGGKGQLKFTGSAVHGGGSCQVSITTDLEPNANSEWKVIKSIIGGCPKKGVEGNLPADPNGHGADTYEFTIPKDLAAGKYSLAWTWFNKVGNREMYMNCAPITVTGSGGSKDALSSLPNMFKANIFGGDPTGASGQCRHSDTGSLKFPDPGNDVEKNEEGVDAPADCAQFNKGGSGGGSGGNNGGDGGDKGGDDGNNGGGDGGNNGGDAPPPDAPPADKPKTEQPNPDNGGGSGGAAHNAGEACSSDGAWNCIGGSQYQRCASGVWSAAQPVAAPCVPGEGPDLKYAAKRSVGGSGMRKVVRRTD